MGHYCVYKCYGQIYMFCKWSVSRGAAAGVREPVGLSDCGRFVLQRRGMQPALENAEAVRRRRWKREARSGGAQPLWERGDGPAVQPPAPMPVQTGYEEREELS